MLRIVGRKWVVLTALVLVYGGCDSTGTEEVAVPVSPFDSVAIDDVLVDSLKKTAFCNADTDGDGIINCDEILVYVTDPYKKDTDGDGWDDNEEITQYSAANPTLFNPLIADLPQLEVVLKTTPQIAYIYESSTSKSEEKVVSKGSSVSRDNSVSNSFSSSFAWEQGWKLGYGLEVEVGFPKNTVTHSVSIEASGSYSQESVRGWGSETSVSRTQSLEEAQSFAKEEGITYKGGRIGVGLAIRNTGNLAYTVNELGITAYSLGVNDRDPIQVIGGLTQELGFKKFTLRPGEESGVFNYVNDVALSPGDIPVLLTQKHGIITSTSGYNISMNDINGRTIDFTRTATKVNSLTAEITIDYGPTSLNKAKKLRVATLNKINLRSKTLDTRYLPVTLKEIAKTMKLDHVEGAKGLVGVDGLQNETAQQASWYVLQTNMSKSTTKIFHAEGRPAFLDSIVVNSGDFIQLVFTVDRDGDKVPARMEQLLGTSDLKKDSDGDGLTDFTEVTGFVPKGGTDSVVTDPAVKDTDGDGLDDGTDLKPRRPSSLDVPIALTRITLRLADNRADTVGWNVAAKEVAKTIADRTFNSGSVDVIFQTSRVNSDITVNGIKAAETTVQKQYASTVKIPIGPGTIKISWFATDTSKTRSEYTISLTGELQNFGTIEFTPSGTNSYTETNMKFNWGEIYDVRVKGYMVVVAPSYPTGFPTSFSIKPLVGETKNGALVVAWTDKSGSASEVLSGLKWGTKYLARIYTWDLDGGVYVLSNPKEVVLNTTSISLINPAKGDPERFSDEAPGISNCPNGLITGVACFGSDCDDMSLYCGEPSFGTAGPAVTGTTTTDGAAPTTNATAFMSGLKCSGDNCDDLTPTFTPYSEFVPDVATCVWGKYISEEGAPTGNLYTCPANQAVNGLRCTGSNCDNVSVQCCSLKQK